MTFNANSNQHFSNSLRFILSPTKIVILSYFLITHLGVTKKLKYVHVSARKKTQNKNFRHTVLHTTKISDYTLLIFVWPRRIL